ESSFSSLASALFILPFFILSALAGQLADMRDKAKIIRTVKMCEIGLMMIGAAG
ncbi:MAG TPA: MFS transporter, partial [Gammaproteobacteria bacterium]|nr:MFS transporter [Gammaproteobacteria bacterium]